MNKIKKTIFYDSNKTLERLIMTPRILIFPFVIVLTLRALAWIAGLPSGEETAFVVFVLTACSWLVYAIHNFETKQELCDE